MTWLDDLQLDEVGATRVTAHLVVGPQHHQPFGLVHGGVWCSVVETVASIGAYQAAQQFGPATVVGVSNLTDFVRSTTEGRVDVAGWPIHVGRSQQLWQVEINRSVDGKLVARGQVRLQNLAELPGSG
ncbi:MAG: PaaI family thioesterase [Acidobacteria bacterium]|nr:PaaI family thioesterase [Acidobacteriota bacterium]